MVLGRRYRVVEKVGRGAFATVWRADDLNQDCVPVALKVLDPRGSAFGWATERFVDEAGTTSKLAHDAIARNLGHFVEGDFRVLVFEYVEGDTLRHEMGRRAAQRRGFAFPEVGRVLDALLDGLGYAHASGFVHRDLKPANLVVRSLTGNASSAITILDFGVAKILEREVAEATTVGRLVGTALYMAPEQIAAAPDVDARADVFAVGVLAYELLSLRSPWLRDSSGAVWRFTSEAIAADALNNHRSIMTRIVTGDRPPIQDVRDGLPAGVSEAVERALAVDRQARFQSAADFRSAIVKPLGVEPSAKVYLVPPLAYRGPVVLPPSPVLPREVPALPPSVGRDFGAILERAVGAVQRPPTPVGWAWTMSVSASLGSAVTGIVAAILFGAPVAGLACFGLGALTGLYWLVARAGHRRRASDLYRELRGDPLVRVESEVTGRDGARVIRAWMEAPSGVERQVEVAFLPWERRVGAAVRVRASIPLPAEVAEAASRHERGLAAHGGALDVEAIVVTMETGVAWAEEGDALRWQRQLERVGVVALTFSAFEARADVEIAPQAEPALRESLSALLGIFELVVVAAERGLS
ncbi:MAG: serine/threonine-protein kinase [Myxococcota bacterium]